MRLISREVWKSHTFVDEIVDFFAYVYNIQIKVFSYPYIKIVDDSIKHICMNYSFLYTIP